MPGSEVRHALELALEAEKTSLRHYLGWAFATRNVGGKDIFIRLATDEYEHMRLLEGRLAAWCADRPCPPVSIARSEVEQIVALIPDASRRIRGEEGQGDLSALLAALEGERRAERFYTEHAKGPAADPFTRLAEMERAHVELIQAEIDHIQSTGFWFGVQEFTLEGQ